MNTLSSVLVWSEGCTSKAGSNLTAVCSLKHRNASDCVCSREVRLVATEMMCSFTQL